SGSFERLPLAVGQIAVILEIALVETALAIIQQDGERFTKERFEYQVAIGISIHVARDQPDNRSGGSNRYHTWFESAEPEVDFLNEAEAVTVKVSGPGQIGFPIAVEIGGSPTCE